jgi:TolB-like protein/DNA-binding winged helix-turn-helix (wHTH) protein
MDALTGGDVFLFEQFRLDRNAGVLFRRCEEGTFAPVVLGSRAFDVLDVLVGRAGDLVSRDEFMTAVWPATVVEDTNLNMQIAALRRVLDERRTDGSCIQTIPGRGYRFAVPVTRGEASAPPVSGHPSGNGSKGPIAARPEPENPAESSRFRNMPPRVPSRERKWVWCSGLALVAGALCLVAVAATVSNWYPPQARLARPAPRLSIVVLPFTALSDDHDAQNLADGVTEDLTTDLSLLPDVLVTSRRTAFSYGNKLVETKRIGGELGVRYALEGSVQRSGSQLRVNAQLIDTETDTELWAERFEREMDDLSAFQREITSRIANSLGVELIAAEAARPTDHPDAFDYILRGRVTHSKPPSRDVYAEAIGWFERALALDPQSVEAKSLLANALVVRVEDGMSNSANSARSDIARAGALVDQVLAASPRSGYAHLVKGRLLKVQTRCEEAILEFETSLALNRGSLWPLHHLAQCKLDIGSIEEVIPLEEQAIRLSPREPRIGWWYRVIGSVDLLQSRTDEAIVLLEKARSGIPDGAIIRAHLAAAYGLKGETGRAAAELAEARRLWGGDAWPSVAKMKTGRWWRSMSPKTRALHETTFAAGLRKIGMPEE